MKTYISMICVICISVVGLNLFAQGEPPQEAGDQPPSAAAADAESEAAQPEGTAPPAGEAAQTEAAPAPEAQTEAAQQPPPTQYQPVQQPTPQAPPPSYSPRPSTGLGPLISGSIFLGIGALNMLFTPVCVLSDLPDDTKNRCLATSLVGGGIFVAVGIPLVVVGAVKRRRYKEWRDTQYSLYGFSFTAARNSGGVAWNVRF